MAFFADVEGPRISDDPSPSTGLCLVSSTAAFGMHMPAERYYGIPKGTLTQVMQLFCAMLFFAAILVSLFPLCYKHSMTFMMF